MMNELGDINESEEADRMNREVTIEFLVVKFCEAFDLWDVSIVEAASFQYSAKALSICGLVDHKSEEYGWICLPVDNGPVRSRTISSNMPSSAVRRSSFSVLTRPSY